MHDFIKSTQILLRFDAFLTAKCGQPCECKMYVIPQVSHPYKLHWSNNMPQKELNLQNTAVPQPKWCGWGGHFLQNAAEKHLILFWQMWANTYRIALL